MTGQRPNGRARTGAGGVGGGSRTRRATPSTLGLVACLLLTGCGAQVQKDAAAGAEKTIENCGRSSTYSTPRKPVAYDVSAIEKMSALGLADRMRGIVLPRTVSSVVEKSPYREDYAKTETISDTVLGQDAVVGARADWVFAGWQAGFSEARGVTPDSLREVGINSYMQHETCKGHQGDTSEPYTAGHRTALNGMIELAGAESVTKDLDARWDTVGWESVVTSEPQAIVVVDYDKQPVQEKVDYLKNRSPLKDSPAVKSGNIHVMDYGEAVSSPRNMDGAQKLADYLRSKGLR